MTKLFDKINRDRLATIIALLYNTKNNETTNERWKEMQELNVIDKSLPIDLGVADEVIAGLKGRLTGLTADTHNGYQQVKAGIAEVTTLRTGVERDRKELKKSALDWGRKVDSEAKRVTNLILEIERPLRLEKARIDSEADRKRKEVEELRLKALADKERAENEAREKAEQAERAEEQKQREADEAKLQAEREALAKERAKLDEQRRQSEQRQREAEQKNRAEREAIEEEKRKIEVTARKQREEKEAAVRKEREAKEAAQRKAAEEKKRFAEIEAERYRAKVAKRLEKERKPDNEKLRDYGRCLWSVERPYMATEWGQEQLDAMLQRLKLIYGKEIH